MKTKYMTRSVIAMILAFVFAGFAAVQTINGKALPKDDAVKYTHNANNIPNFEAAFTGVGPVVNGSVEYSTLPVKARKFLEKYCDGHAVVKCTKEFSSGEYDIQLADGLTFEFDTKGNVVETTAPEGYSLSKSLLKAVVPGKLYHMLINNGFDASVESVHHERSGYSIEVADPVFKAVTFDPTGILTLVVND